MTIQIVVDDIVVDIIFHCMMCVKLLIGTLKYNMSETPG